MSFQLQRRAALAGLAALATGACTKIAESPSGRAVAKAAEGWHRRAHRVLASRQALAREYSKSEISPTFKGNGTVRIPDEVYQSELAEGFPNWRLEVSGLVDTPLSLSMDDIRAMSQRTQITRHDCVEGWSAIGEWTGPQLSDVLDAAGVQEEAKFIVFRCADTLAGGDYFESVDMIDAYHPQTIIAHQLNGEAIPQKNGAPLRMRIERQLGYKHPKYLTAIEAVASFDEIGDGKGGYWEDRANYQWYAGI